MGKIVAVGGGFDEVREDYSLILHTMELTGKAHPRFLLTPTSAFDNVNRDTLSRYFKAGCEVDTLLLTDARLTEEEIAQKIGSADIIRAPGGNLKYLTHIWRKTGADIYMKQAYRRGTVLTGGSAGAMCWFAQGYDNCALYDEKELTDGIGILPYCFCPHYESESWQTFNEAVYGASYSAIACEDNAAVCFVDGRRYLFKCRDNATAWFFDRSNGFRRTNLEEDAERLQML